MDFFKFGPLCAVPHSERRRFLVMIKVSFARSEAVDAHLRSGVVAVADVLPWAR